MRIVISCIIQPYERTWYDKYDMSKFNFKHFRYTVLLPFPMVYILINIPSLAYTTIQSKELFVVVKRKQMIRFANYESATLAEKKRCASFFGCHNVIVINQFA